ncbi:MAG: hypothetical protein HY913_13780 [Desulfomonile tiedjei]|nr:hypothetical protein [Desulfomonile tiedjei]
MFRNLVAGLILGILSILWSLPAFSMVNASGRWYASHMGTVMEVTINQNGPAINGVAHVHNPSGKTDTYHFTGNVQGNSITAVHPSGHRFAGSINANGQLVGVVRTKSGHKISLVASRR